MNRNRRFHTCVSFAFFLHPIFAQKAESKRSGEPDPATLAKVILDRLSFGTPEEFAQVFPDEERTRPRFFNRVLPLIVRPLLPFDDSDLTQIAVNEFLSNRFVLGNARSNAMFGRDSKNHLQVTRGQNQSVLTLA